MKRTSLYTIATSILIFGSIVFAQGRAPQTASSAVALARLAAAPHTANAQNTQLLCSLSGFFSVDPDGVITNKITLDGRGLLNCRSEQGFTSEVPVVLTASIDFTKVSALTQGEIAFSLNSTTFVIPREASQLEDSYEVRDTSNSRAPTSDASYLLRGEKRDIVIDSKLSSTTTSIAAVKLTNLKIRFDDSAPDLRTSY